MVLVHYLVLGHLNRPCVVLVALEDEHLGGHLLKRWRVVLHLVHQIPANADHASQRHTTKCSQIQRHLAALGEPKQKDLVARKPTLVYKVLHQTDQVRPDLLLDLQQALGTVWTEYCNRKM